MDNDNKSKIKTPSHLATFGEELADVKERIELLMEQDPDRFRRVSFEGVVSADESGITIRTRDYDNDADNECFSFEELFAEGWKERAQQAREEARQREEQRRREAQRRSQELREAHERDTYERLKLKFENAQRPPQGG